MGTLSCYLFRRQVIAIGWLLIGVVGLVAMIDLTETLSRFDGVEGFGLSTALLLVALHLPPILEQVLPFAVLLASMIVLVRLNRAYELVVARAVGVSAWRFLLPVMLASFLVGVVSLFTLNPLAAWTLRYEEALSAELLGDRARDGERIAWLRQREADGRTVISAQSATADGRTLRGVVFYRIDPDGTMRERIDAPVAELGEGAWLLRDAVVTRAGEAPVPAPRYGVSTSISPETVAQRASPPEATPFPSLFSRIEGMRRLGLPVQAFTMQLHSLLTRPVLFVGMTLIAATVSLRFARFGQARTVVVGGLAAAFALYVATVLVRAFGEAGIVPPFVAAWIPVSLALFGGTALLLRSEDG